MQGKVIYRGDINAPTIAEWGMLMCHMGCVNQ